MATSKFSQYWTLITILLVTIIVISGIVIWLKYSPSQPIEISIPMADEMQGKIYVGGAVSNPGFYPLKTEDTVAALIQAAGGTTDNADLNRLTIHIPKTQDEEPSQKINLNRAEVWLLEALPEIGGTRAQNIVTYREQNGPFCNIKELTKVEGIGTTTYEKIKHLITVAD